MAHAGRGPARRRLTLFLSSRPRAAGEERAVPTPSCVTCAPGSRPGVEDGVGRQYRQHDGERLRAPRGDRLGTTLFSARPRHRSSVGPLEPVVEDGVVATPAHILGAEQRPPSLQCRGRAARARGGLPHAASSSSSRRRKSGLIGIAAFYHDRAARRDRLRSTTRRADRQITSAHRSTGRATSRSTAALPLGHVPWRRALRHRRAKAIADLRWTYRRGGDATSATITGAPREHRPGVVLVPGGRCRRTRAERAGAGDSRRISFAATSCDVEVETETRKDYRGYRSSVTTNVVAPPLPHSHGAATRRPMRSGALPTQTCFNDVAALA